MKCNDLKVMPCLVLILFVTIGPGELSHAVPSPSVPSVMAPHTVKGEVVVIAGELQAVKDGADTKEVLIMDELYVVKNGADEGIFLLVDESTKLNGTVQVGDKIEAQVSADGHALSIQSVQETQ